MADILQLPDKRMRLYIRYFFQKRVTNLSKAKKAQLQEILSPLLEEHFAKEGEIQSESSGAAVGIHGGENEGDSNPGLI